MHTSVRPKHALFAGITVAMLTYSALSGGVVPLVIAPLLLVYFALELRGQQISYTENICALLMVLLWLILSFYAAMFTVIEVKKYLQVGADDYKFVVQCGTTLLYALMAGAVVALTFTYRSRPNEARRYELSEFQVDLLFVLAWLPLLLNAAVYLVSFSGRDYVEVHTSGAAGAGLVMKGIYLSFGAVVNLCIGAATSAKLRRRFVSLTIGYLVVYGMLFKLRSPLLFYLLILLFFYGKHVAFAKIFFSSAIALMCLLGIAMVRDPTLGETAGAFAMVNMLVNFGDFADTLNFARTYLSKDGPLFGSSILGGLLGFGEPLANIYAKSISVEYFESGGGFGFFFLSEIYMNFGYVGGMIVLFVLGFGLVRLNQVRHSDYTVALVAVIFASMLALVRNDLGTTLRGILYTFVATWLVCLIVNIFRHCGTSAVDYRTV